MLALAAGLALAIGLAAAWSQRRGLAEQLLMRWIAASGISPVALRVDRLELGSIDLRDITLGSPPTTTVAALEASWSPGGLWSGRLDTLLLRGTRVEATLAQGQLSLGALDPAVRGSEEPMLPLLLPARKIELRDASGQLATPWGPASLGLDGQLLENPDGTLSGSLRARAEHAWGELSGEMQLAGVPTALEASWWLEPRATGLPGLELGATRIEGSLEGRGERLRGQLRAPSTRLAYEAERGRAEVESPELSLRFDLPAQEEAQADLTARGGRIRLPALAVELRGLELDARLAGAELSGEARIDELRDTGVTRRFVPFGARLRFSGPPHAVGFEARLADGKRRLEATAEGKLDAIAGTAEARVALSPLRFEPGGTQPADLAPVLGPWARDVSGEVEGRLRAGLHAAGSSFRGELALRDLSLRNEYLSVQGLNGTLSLVGPTPLLTPEEQLLAIALLDVGLPLLDGLVAFRLRPDGAVEVREAHWSWAGGRLSTATTLDPRADDTRAVLEASGLDVAQLLAQVDLEGLSGTGTLSGRIPLVLRGEQVRVEKAVLASQEAGQLRYQPPSGVGALGTAQPEGFGVALQALSDFRYESLELRIDGDAGGELELRVHLRGSNPNFQGGRTVEFNVTLEAHISDLVRAGVATYRIPQVIEERLRDFSTRGAQ